MVFKDEEKSLEADKLLDEEILDSSKDQSDNQWSSRRPHHLTHLAILYVLILILLWQYLRAFFRNHDPGLGFYCQCPSIQLMIT